MTQMDLLNRHIQNVSSKHETIFLLAPHGNFFKTDHILGHKVSLNMYQKIGITPCILLDPHGLVFNNNTNFRKPKNSWKRTALN